mgnify:CR=1 FL=1
MSGRTNSNDPTDPTEPLCAKAATYPGVNAGTSCNQSAFKFKKKAFLYCGPQGGRFKAMFKLGPSRAQAEALQAEFPDKFDVGKTAYVTARFTAEDPIPEALWTKWLDESYAECGGKL